MNSIHNLENKKNIKRYTSNEFEHISNKEEVWKFIPLDRLVKLISEDYILKPLNKLPQCNEDTDVSISWIAKTDYIISSSYTPENFIEAKVWESCEKIILIDILNSVKNNKFITINLDEFSEQPESAHIVIRAKQNSSSRIFLHHQGNAKFACNIEIIVENSAELTIISFQDWNKESIHIASQKAKLGNDAFYKHINITFGGDLLRLSPSVTFTGEHSTAEMYGIYFAESGQYQEHRSLAHHVAMNCKSNILYKGILTGKKVHTVWVGDVIIGKNAQGTNTYEVNRNMLLNKENRADSVPNLEIENSLIEKAGHASATGHLNDEHMFYIKSRGIHEKDARRLMVHGFLNEVIQKIECPDIEKLLLKKINLKLKNI